ncbi:MAG: pirin family protein [Myxococcaceae bacterium]|nr:pirin family protein [Myxococcaceae bacterium]
MPVFTHRPRSSLPLTDLGWVRMTDHFVQTVGAGAGNGQALGDLLVLADATFAPKSRFPLHPHRDMEIVSVVLSGELTHHEPDTSTALPAASVQLMSARDGIVHAEGNVTDAPTRMLQLWITPNQSGGPAVHRIFGPFTLKSTLTRVTPDDLRQDASVSMAKLAAGEQLALEPKPGRRLYVLCAGEAKLGALAIADGDGVTLAGGAATFTAAAGGATLVVIDTRT